MRVELVWVQPGKVKNKKTGKRYRRVFDEMATVDCKPAYLGLLDFLDHPLGITHNDVRNLRLAASAVYDVHDKAESDTLRELADRIEYLLPPRE